MTTEVSQQPVIDFLGNAVSHGGLPVKRIDTHAASVFLAGDRAYKIKRAVQVSVPRLFHARKTQGGV